MPTTTPSDRTPVRPRRAPAPGDRRRDAEGTRKRILDAALSEFAARGFAGARVADIAQGAGVNQQLISYYFGGKEGLYDELLAQWHRREAAFAREDQSLADLVAGYLAANHADPDMARLLIWDELTSHGGPRSPDAGEPGEAGETGDVPEVADIRRRQAAGEIAADLDPGFLLLALMGAVAAGVTMPHMAERVCGVDPATPEFLERYADQLRRIVTHLA
jgi:TetR/AcrR family transcriptional regulator